MGPADWGRLKKLDLLDIHQNRFFGEALPRAFLEGCTSLRELRAGANDFDLLEIPVACELRRVELFANRLAGNLSETLANAPRLIHLNLAQNDLRGDIPIRVLSQLPLAELYLTKNRLADPAAQGAEVQANLPNCRVSVDEHGYVRGSTPEVRAVEVAESDEKMLVLSEQAAMAFFDSRCSGGSAISGEIVLSLEVRAAIMSSSRSVSVSCRLPWWPSSVTRSLPMLSTSRAALNVLRAV